MDDLDTPKSEDVFRNDRMRIYALTHAARQSFEYMSHKTGQKKKQATDGDLSHNELHLV